MTNQQFDKLTVVSYSQRKSSGAYWNCVCVCGNKKEAYGGSLRNGTIRHCGCETNKRSRSITANNKTQKLEQWSKETGLSRNVIDSRIKRGWSNKEAVTLPIGTKLKTNKGKSKNDRFKSRKKHNG